MRKNRSPWLHQLDKSRIRMRLAHDESIDVCIVGGGIAGISTAFFALKYTDKQVMLVEGYRLGHGASGHNAGQVVAYFEKSFKEMVRDFGVERTADAQRAIESAWDLIEEVYRDAKLDIFFHKGIGHDGYTTYEQVVRELEEYALRRDAGLTPPRMAVAANAPFLDSIPEKYSGLYQVLPKAKILEMLETDNEMFIAVASLKKGTVNSALFCEQVAAYLQATYPERFTLYEETPIHKVILQEEGAVLDAERATVVAKKVILCTNGFENFHIIHHNRLALDGVFHYSVRGRVAYMSAYLESSGNPPVALSYETPSEPTENLPYYYLTRRPFSYEEEEHSLISVGGPEEAYEDSIYSRDLEYPEHAMEILDTFIRTIFNKEGKTEQYVFTWHGLMGYTQNGMRMVGPEPQHPSLLYNLGCNGVGILTSLMGGRMIARYLAGEKVAPSVFSVPEGLAALSQSSNEEVDVL